MDTSKATEEEEKRGKVAGASNKVGKEETKRNTGGTLDERGIFALERVADSMEALVRTSTDCDDEEDGDGDDYQGSIPNCDAASTKGDVERNLGGCRRRHRCLLSPQHLRLRWPPTTSSLSDEPI